MFRLTQIMRQALRRQERRKQTRAAWRGPVVVWNLIRRCNLDCLHCYSASADRDFAGELTTAEASAVLTDLRQSGVPAVIFSGGEPLLRPDLFALAREAKGLGLYVGLSTNGTLLDDTQAAGIADAGFDYVGISLDGLPVNHDRIRNRQGAFQAALNGLRRCRDRGVKAGARFTLTRDNAGDLPGLLTLLEREEIPRFYLSHLNYAGRGNANRAEDAELRVTRDSMEYLFQLVLEDLEHDREREIVTGNNDADGVFLLLWLRRQLPEAAARAEAILTRWGGNASGVGVANIDNRGNVHPDIFWWHHTLGNVRERPFSEIWRDEGDPILAGLRRRPKPLHGRCGACIHQAICGGNTRVRAHQLTGDPWGEDPGCYLTDDEIGLAEECVA